MSIAVVSPHLDDATFSVGEHMIGHNPVTIVCPFGGVPDDTAGRTKYLTLLAEHANVCNSYGWGSHVGPYLDDVYDDSRSLSGLQRWLLDAVDGFTDVWIPWGIHHPDHKEVAGACKVLADYGDCGICIYEELPYRVLYPVSPLFFGTLLGYTPRLRAKQDACRTYASQINEDIERCLYVPERVWRLR